jgi:pimeloyl-ACP methyl ester carboxylesterase
MTEARIDRHFVRLAAGQVHYRSAGAARPGGPPPLYVAHASPGSSLGLVGMAAHIGGDRLVIAPDMLGNGDSDPPDREPSSLDFYVDCAVELLDRLELDRIDFYGCHTGAQIGLELAIRHPDRVRRLVLDGAPLFSEDLKRELLAHYAPRVAPDAFGGQFAWAWNFVRDQMWHFPYFMRDPEHRMLHSLVPPPDALHLGVVDVLKALDTYHLAYRAAFTHEVGVRAPLIRTPTLVMATETDPLGVYVEDLTALIPGAVCARVPRDRRIATVRQFIDDEMTMSQTG